MKSVDSAGDSHVLWELEEVVERELNRHLSATREWFPHEYVPWSRGRDFDSLPGGEPWSPEQSPVGELAAIALKVNLLTEDNLPTYHHQFATLFGEDGAWGTWVHRWTAEEARHSVVIRDYLLTSRAIDPVDLERARMAHMSTAPPGNDVGVLENVAYVAFQELATRISHRNTGRVSGDPVCERLLARVAMDENLHMVFYRNVLAAALEIAPDDTMRAITNVVSSFAMPGAGIPGFTRAAARMAVGDIYNIRIHHDEVLQPVLRHLDALHRSGLGAEGRRVQDELGRHLEAVGTQANRFDEKRATVLARMADREKARPEGRPRQT
ncbi:acyl-ACP desaturase [Streptomyces gossypiisoli]|uniref:acyl-ACP desaturase n=1 Tax=Streptomyces gossypiisoli TaxID=2748864 RepID=UPI0015DA0A4F|nr:acyl-ACP desaturase [Streptomyces gossypiisoli]